MCDINTEVSPVHAKALMLAAEAGDEPAVAGIRQMLEHGGIDAGLALELNLAKYYTSTVDETVDEEVIVPPEDLPLW